MNRWTHSVVLTSIGFWLSACPLPPPPTTPCQTALDCPPGYRCGAIERRCLPGSVVDAGSAGDRVVSDAPWSDTGRFDAAADAGTRRDGAVVEDTAIDPGRTRHWVLVDDTGAPGALHGPKTAFHSRLQTVFLYGGATVGSDPPYSPALWRYEGANWSPECAVCEPGPRSGHGLVYDAAGDRLLLFGGLTMAGATEVIRNDLWEWRDGSGWREIGLAGASPSARHSFFAAYDQHRQRLVVFGGWLASGAQTDELWEYGGNDWQQMPANPPWPAQRYTMVQSITYHPLVREIVIFGGFHDAINQQFDDMWSWDGVRWRQLCAACTGLPRGGNGLAYDEVNGRIVLQGGWSQDELAGTWEWDGVSFTVCHPDQPPQRDSTALVYDRARQVIVMYGGNNEVNLDDVYEYVLDP